MHNVLSLQRKGKLMKVMVNSIKIHLCLVPLYHLYHFSFKPQETTFIAHTSYSIHRQTTSDTEHGTDLHEL
jgi:hypothetical protein